MSLFGNNNNNNFDNGSNDRLNQSMVTLVGEKSIFGKHYTKICQILQMRNVPASRMPSREHFMSRVFACLDEEKLSKWLEKYVEIEAIVDEEENDDIIGQDK